MLTAEQYRAKALEYSKLLRVENNLNAWLEFQRLQRNFTELADNAQWVTDNHDTTLNAAEVAAA
jgi:hypothetical protein